MGVYDVKSSKARITLIAGHYGSGKSEIAVNYALSLAQAVKEQSDKAGEEARPITLFDLDIVNPYFRSREAAGVLTASGVKVTSSAEAFPDVDLPYMPPELTALFQNPNQIGVLDIGGDPVGARVLARYGIELNRVIAAGEAEFWCVINANRPMTKTPEAATMYVKQIENTAGVKVTGLINNTHLFSETEPEDIYRGAELAKKVSQEIGVPLVFSVVKRLLLEEFMNSNETVFPIDILLKKPWEK